jgi:hypothetical protein
VTYVTYSGDYDNAGDYFYMIVDGQGLNCDKFYPVLVTEDRTEVTEFVSWTNGDSDKGGSGYATFKLRKLDGFINDATMEFKFVSLEDYPEIKCVGIDKNIYTSTGDEIVKLVYNYKAKEYVLYASSKVPLGTELTVTVSEYDTNEVYGVGKTVLSNGKNTVNIQTEDGDFFECDPYHYWSYYYNVKGQAVIDGELKEINCEGYVREDSGGFAGYGTTEEAKESIGYTGESYQKSGTALTAEFTVYNNATYAKGDAATLSLAQYDATNKTYTTVATTAVSATVSSADKKAIFTGKFTADTAFATGNYRVSLINASGKVLQTAIIKVYANNSIYQSYQTNGLWSYGKDLSIYAGFISNKTMDKSKFSFEFYDINKNKITDWSLASAT